MARPKEYERNTVLNNATELFWQRGFEACSMSDLVEVTGLNRHSMYGEFGSKSGLFRASLNHYDLSFAAEVFSNYDNSNEGLVAIQKVFQKLKDYLLIDGFKGCFVTNSIVEKDSFDPETQKSLAEKMIDREEYLFKCLKAAQEQGQMDTRADIRSLAKFLITFIQGLMVLPMLSADRKGFVVMLDKVLQELKLQVV